MLRRAAAILGLLVLLATALPAGAAGAPKPPPAPPPAGFFGVAPQDWLTDRDAEYMVAGGIETVRWPLEWAGAQPTKNGPYLWGQLDRTLMIATRHGLRVEPFVFTSASKNPLIDGLAMAAYMRLLPEWKPGTITAPWRSVSTCVRAISMGRV